MEHKETRNNQQRFICYRMQHIYGNNTNENLLSQRDNGKLRINDFSNIQAVLDY